MMLVGNASDDRNKLLALINFADNEDIAYLLCWWEIGDVIAESDANYDVNSDSNANW